MPSDIHEAANTTKEGWIAWFCPLKLYRHYSGCRIWSGLLYRNYIKLYVSFCAARPGFVAYLFVVQYTTAVLYRCFYIRFVLPLIFLSYPEADDIFLSRLCQSNTGRFPLWKAIPTVYVALSISLIKKQDSQNVRQAYISIFRNRINVPITNNLSRR